MNSGIRYTTVAWPVTDVSARLASQDAVLCAASLLAGDAELAHALTVLSGNERARYTAYTNTVVARRFAIGRALLREIVACALGASPERVPLREGLHGKPYLGRDDAGRPLWFSVAHCEDVLVVALSRTCDVGVDLERARAIEQWERVADRVLGPMERSQLRCTVDAGEDAGIAFLRHWCRVEAELKAIGCGIAGLEEHRAGKRPLGLRLADVTDLPLPAAVMANGARYLAALALCASGVECARQSTLASSHADAPTVTPARTSTR